MTYVLTYGAAEIEADGQTIIIPITLNATDIEILQLLESPSGAADLNEYLGNWGGQYLTINGSVRDLSKAVTDLAQVNESDTIFYLFLTITGQPILSTDDVVLYIYADCFQAGTSIVGDAATFSQSSIINNSSVSHSVDSLAFTDVARAFQTLLRGYRLSHPDRQAGTDFGFCNRIKTPSGKAYFVEKITLSDKAGFKTTPVRIGDALALTDSAAAIEGLQDRLSMTDAATTRVVIAVSDTLSFSDSAQGGVHKSVTDTLSFSDSAGFAFQLFKFSDSLSLQDAASSNLEKQSDGIGFVDTASANVVILIKESLSLSDAASALITVPTVHDALSLSDLCQVVKYALMDHLTLQDGVMTDQGTIGDVFAFIPDQGGLSFSDSAKATAHIAAADELTFTDSAKATAAIGDSEGLSLSDVWTVRKYSAPYATQWS